MSSSRALASFVTCATDLAFRSDHLKLCVLWYDEVLFESLGSFDQRSFLEGLLADEEGADRTATALSDVLVPLHKLVGNDFLEDLNRSGDPGYPRWGERHENYTYPDPETPERYAHNHLLGRIAAEHGVEKFEGHEIELAEGRARVAVDAVRLWSRVNRVAPCMLQAGQDEKAAMAAVQQFEAKVQPLAPATLFEMAVPSLRAVPWKTVLKLRGEKSLGSLRQKMADAVEKAGTNVDDAKKALSGLEQEAMEAIVGAVRPRPRKVGVEAILANVPGLPVMFNPASVYFGVRDTVKAARMERDFGWLYLLRDIRAATQGERE